MSTTNIFHNASLKLTSVYLVIIMLISLVFSIGIYNLSSSEIERGIRRQTGPIGQILRTRNNDLIEDLILEQDKAVTSALNRLKANLFLINAFILLFGGLVSYYLARMTLTPIEKAHESLEQFTADASHELRTPITAMRTETEVTLTDPKLSLSLARKQLESNIEELDKLSNLADGLLQLADLENNGLEKQDVSVLSVIESSVDRVMKNAKQKHQKILVNKEKNGKISVNAPALTEALVTILNNAVKYSPDGSNIKVVMKRTKSLASIMIEDSGIGIKKSDIPRIFDRFYQADKSRTDSKEQGYGIGLSIAKSIVESHGGTISVKSKPRKGSTFTISIPVS